MKPARAIHYQETDVQAAYSVLIELGMLLKEYQNQIVLIGGFVPFLTISGQPEHLGTLDIDLNFDLDHFQENSYNELLKHLELAGFERDNDPRFPFRLKRIISSITVVVDLLTPTTTQAQYSFVQAIKGAQFALTNFETVTLEGITPTGNFERVTWRISSLQALFVMKGIAVSEQRAKDAYDLYYVLRHHPSGVVGIARACQTLLHEPVARNAFERIHNIFRGDDDLGSQLIASFMLESNAMGDMTPEEIMQDAYQRFRVWWEVLNETEKMI